jgi:hypothetical protein
MGVRVGVERVDWLKRSCRYLTNLDVGLALEVYPLKRRDPDLMASRGTLQA